MLPLLYISFYKALKSVCKEITRIQVKFLQGWDREESKIAWVKWKNVCKPKEEGGLGIKDIQRFNIVMLAKYKQRLGMKKHGL